MTQFSRAAETDLYSSDFWEIAGTSKNVTWVEIHNSQEARKSGIAHVSILTKKKGDPGWELAWVHPHLAITTDALKRSVIRPLKIKGAYPEKFMEAYGRWKEDEKRGTASVCTTSIQDFFPPQ